MLYYRLNVMTINSEGNLLDFTVNKIANGIELINVNASHFKTNELSVNIAVPLKKETASANALLINLLSRRSKTYPTLAALNKKLANLYGAAVSGGVIKQGEYQVLKLGITSIDDRFSLDESSISLEGIKLLCDMIFNPKLDENGLFEQKDIEDEKRILIEKIEAEENEKRTYVLRKAEELMFADEPYSINRYGTIESVKAVNSNDLICAWQNVLKSGKIVVIGVGGANVGALKETLENAFGSIERDYNGLPESVFVPSCEKVKDHTERIDVKQGKLVLGFRVNLKSDDELTTAMITFSNVFGGGPFSKLFANVREKLSLCYYCSAQYNRSKSFIMVQCGCNEENMDKAISEILNQLEAIKNGDFDEELKSSVMAMSDTYTSVEDMPEVLENFYASQIVYDKTKSPLEYAENCKRVTKEQVQKCAQLLSLDTIYRLASKEAE